MIRIGSGFDVHAFATDRRLVLAGVDIPHTAGLLGHSDADVLSHALIDALLGALALGDIGTMFPDNEPAYKDANSLDLLRQVTLRLHQYQATIINVDATVALQCPKIAPYVSQMRRNIADCLAISIEQVSVKATTTEQLSFIGREEGAAAFAVALLEVRTE